MARVYNGVNQYLENATPPVSAYPFTISLWFWSDDNSTDNGMYTWSYSFSSFPYMLLGHAGATGSNKLRFSMVESASTYRFWDTTAAVTAQVWNHACAVARNANDNQSFLNGNGAGSAGTGSFGNPAFPSSANLNTIGQLTRNSAAWKHKGRSAYLTVWDVELTQGEITALAAGWPAPLIRPSRIRSHAELFGNQSPEPDRYRAAHTFVLNGGPTSNSQPPKVFRQSGPIIPLVTAQPQTVIPAGIATAEAFGTPTLSTSVLVLPSGVTTAEAFGVPTLSSIRNVPVNAIASAEAFGAPSLSAFRNVPVDAIASAEALGSPTLTSGVAVQPDAVASAEAFGSPTLATTVVVPLDGVVSEEAFGTPALVTGVVLQLDAIPSAEAFGDVALATSIVVPVDGIVSAEAFGVPDVDILEALFDISSPATEATLTGKYLTITLPAGRTWIT